MPYIRWRQQETAYLISYNKLQRPVLKWTLFHTDFEEHGANQTFSTPPESNTFAADNQQLRLTIQQRLKSVHILTAISCQLCHLSSDSVVLAGATEFVHCPVPSVVWPIGEYWRTSREIPVHCSETSVVWPIWEYRRTSRDMRVQWKWCYN